MRSSLSMRRQLAREIPFRRLHSFTATPPKTSQPSLRTQICRACGKKLAAFPPNHLRSQQRWQSSSTATATAQADAIKPTPTPGPQTHYDLFPKTLPSGPPPAGPFRIDARELRREFLQLQAVAHPDRHPQHLKTRAEATSARINEAYKTLQSPLLRAQYLLSLRGIDVADDETAKVDDPALLMEVLDAREEIEGVEREEELVELRRENDGRIEASEEVLDNAFRTDDVELATGEAVRLRYWANIKESLDGWEKGKPVVLIH